MSQYNFKLNGKSYSAQVVAQDDNVLVVDLNGNKYTVEVESQVAESKPKVAASQPAIHIQRQATVSAPTAQPKAKAKSIKSPLPGVVLDTLVKPGDVVKRCQNVMVLEAMKMENNIDSDYEGRVASVLKQKGDSVMEGEVLLVLE